MTLRTRLDRNKTHEYNVDKVLRDSAKVHKFQITEKGDTRTVTIQKTFEQKYVNASSTRTCPSSR